MRVFIDELAAQIRRHKVSNLTIRSSETMHCVTSSNGRFTGVSTKRDLQEAIANAIEEMLAADL